MITFDLKSEPAVIVYKRSMKEKGEMIDPEIEEKLKNKVMIAISNSENFLHDKEMIKAIEITASNLFEQGYLFKGRLRVKEYEISTYIIDEIMKI